MENNSESFEEVKGRLDEIVEAVSDDTIPLDDALALYEEAVQLGLRASSLLEENLQEHNALYDEEQEADSMGDEEEIVIGDTDGDQVDTASVSSEQPVRSEQDAD